MVSIDKMIDVDFTVFSPLTFIKWLFKKYGKALSKPFIRVKCEE